MRDFTKISHFLLFIIHYKKGWANHKPDSVLPLGGSAYHLSGWAVARPF